MADLEKIVEELSTLTVMEAAELSKLLEEKWGVSAAAVAVAAPGAAAAAGVLRGLSDNQVKIELDGGILDIHWQEADSPAGGQIIMTGPVATVASGNIPARFFTALADR